MVEPRLYFRWPKAATTFIIGYRSKSTGDMLLFLTSLHTELEII